MPRKKQNLLQTTSKIRSRKRKFVAFSHNLLKMPISRGLEIGKGENWSTGRVLFLKVSHLTSIPGTGDYVLEKKCSKGFCKRILSV